ncbi:MAG: GNAT family N-acetyltransferase [Chitinophagaceae bacterium]|nr:GNAT family N-acetyltransferase [Chitinophagaceae bacterium]
MILQQINDTDIPSCLLLCRSNKWNQIARDWELFLKMNPNECRVAVNNEKIIGSVAIIKYQHFSWIGMLLVDPAFQRKGTGKTLLAEALEILKNEETVKLDATPAGRQLYRQLNFTDEYQIVRMYAAAVKITKPGSSAKQMQKEDLALIAEYDQPIFGSNRQQLLHHFCEGAGEFAFCIKEKDAIKGYCMGRHGYHFSQIGPIVAENNYDAIQLASAALQNCLGKPVIIDSLMHDEQWMAWLSECGFIEQRNFIRMYKGTNRYAGVSFKQFAIAGPEYG